MTDQDSGLEGGSLASLLKTARTGKGFSLEEAAAATRINRSVLAAFEGDQNEPLPAKVFARGLLRSYAVFLGLDPEQVLIQYMSGAADGKEENDKKPLKLPQSNDLVAMSDSSDKLARPRLMVIVFLLIIGGVLAYFILNSVIGSSDVDQPKPLVSGIEEKDRLAEDVTPAALPEPDLIELSGHSQEAVSDDAAKKKTPPTESASNYDNGVTPQVLSSDDVEAKADSLPQGDEAGGLEEKERQEPAETHSEVDELAGMADPAGPADEAEDFYVLEASFIAQTWLSIQLDGGDPREFLFRAGEKRRWEAEQQFSLRIGNAGGVKLSLNGELLPDLGAEGRVVELTLP